MDTAKWIYGTLKLITTSLVTLLSVGVFLILFGYMGMKGSIVTEADLPFEFIYDIGIVLGPASIVGIISNFLLKNEMFDAFYEYKRKNVKPSVVVVEGHKKEIELTKIIEGAKKSIDVIGVCPLDSQMRQTDQFCKVVENVKNIRVLALNPKSGGASAREEQSGNKAFIRSEHEKFQAYMEDIHSKLKSSRKLRSKMYSLPPSSFVCMVDEEVIFTSDYPLGRGGAEMPATIRYCNEENSSVFKVTYRAYMDMFEYAWDHDLTIDFKGRA